MQHSPAAPKLLLFHGLLSSPQEFGLIAHALRMHGVEHEAPVLPGYTEAKDAPPDWKRWRDTAVETVARAAAPDEPVVLGGLCMGGVLAAAAALGTDRPIAGLVLLSPTFTYDGWGLTPLRHLRRFGYVTGLDRFFSVAEREPYGVKSPRIRKWLIREMEERASSALGPARIPLRALREAEKLMAEVRGRLASLNCPLLVVHAREDEITTLGSVQKLFDGLPCRDKTLAVLEDSYHMITIDNDRHRVVSLLAEFVGRLGTPLPQAHAA